MPRKFRQDILITWLQIPDSFHSALLTCGGFGYHPEILSWLEITGFDKERIILREN